MSTSPESVARSVLEALENKDLERLTSLFSEDIVYQDPRVVRHGREEAVPRGPTGHTGRNLRDHGHRFQRRDGHDGAGGQVHVEREAAQLGCRRRVRGRRRRQGQALAGVLRYEPIQRGLMPPGDGRASVNVTHG